MKMIINCQAFFLDADRKICSLKDTMPAIQLVEFVREKLQYVVISWITLVPQSRDEYHLFRRTLLTLFH